jgi:hypothetical protein
MAASTKPAMIAGHYQIAERWLDGALPKYATKTSPRTPPRSC